MREILFRGKRIDNGEWIEGFYCQTNSGSFIRDKSENGFTYPIIPETVGQYTGLTDKNGTKIFEGDIVSTDLERPYNIVEFRQGCFMYECNDGNRDYYDIMLPILDEEQTCDNYVEIIGNIHDNPELLKEGVNNA